VGRENNPPDDDDELLSLLDAPSDKIHLRRAVWVRTLLSGSEEGNRLVAHIQELSNRPSEMAEDNENDKDAQIEELKVKLQELENGR